MTKRLVELSLGGLIAVAIAPAVPAATINVDAGCQLAEAIRSANDNWSYGGCTAGEPGWDTLVLSGDVLLQSFVASVDGENGLPSVTSGIRLEGGGHTIARDTGAGIPRFRIFHVGSAGSLSLRDVALTGGAAREGASLQVRGGAVFNRGSVWLEDTQIIGNEASVGSAGSSTVYAYGGGIYNLGSVTLERSSVSFNEARAGSLLGATGTGVARGGGIYNAIGASLSASLSSLDGNVTAAYGAVAQSEGGAVYSQDWASIRSSSISENRALATGGSAVLLFGGGLWLGGSGSFPDHQVVRSLLRDNRLSTPSTEGAASGGAIFTAASRSVSVVSSTFSYNLIYPPANAVLPSGGAIENRGQAVSLERVTLVGNEIHHLGAVLGAALHSPSGWITVENSIVAHGSAAGDPCVGTIIDGGSNFGCFAGAPAVTGLASSAMPNGGPTHTHALSAVSNAINFGTACGGTIDQRGFSALGPCDSGAYEFNPCIYDDGFETTGSGGSDDTCFGSALEPGVPQPHLHCDPDWVWFVAGADRVYEVRTLNSFPRHPLLTARDSCGPVIATDDDLDHGGPRRLFVRPSAISNIDVEIVQPLDLYNPGSFPPSSVPSYEVQVVCVENCGCAPPDGPDLELTRDRLTDETVVYEACSTITVVSSWSVGRDSTVTLRAGEAVVIGNSPVQIVESGAMLRIEIDPTLAPP